MAEQKKEQIDEKLKELEADLKAATEMKDAAALVHGNLMKEREALDKKIASAARDLSVACGDFVNAGKALKAHRGK